MTEDTFATFLDAIEAGDTLKQAISKAHTSWRAVSQHITADDSAASRYARVRLQSAHFYADKAQEAVEAAYDGQTAQVAKVRADVYKWRASVANPKEFGDRVQADVNVTVGVLHLDALRAPRHTQPGHQVQQAPHALPAPVVSREVQGWCGPYTELIPIDSADTGEGDE